MYAISDTTEQPEAAARLLNFLVNSEDMAMLQKTEKGIPISNSAVEVLKENDLLSGLAYSANQVLEKNQEEMSGMSYILEDEDIYMFFEDEAVYYIYGNMSAEEVADSIYNAFYGS
jgi:oligogalacturonide transport system substrate-binding protein